jgi:hypothetical protein
MSDPRKKRAGLNATAYSHLVWALIAAPCSKAELEELTGMGPSLAARCISALRARGVLYVAGWRPDGRGRMTIREYQLGYGTDVPCPKVPRSEIVAKWKAKAKTRKQS